MSNWKIALEKFLDKYKNEKYFLGAILTGSYATGNNDNNSDIDVYIVTSDDVNWRERGNIKIDGYLIEYFINPRKKVLSYFEEELQDYHMSTTMIFVNGKILYDIDGTIQYLMDTAKENSKLENLADINDFKFKMNCYSVWDGFDELESKYNKREDIDFTYYIFLQRVIDAYFYNNKIPSIPLNKIEKILLDEAFRKKYNVKKLPNKVFIDKIVKCFQEKEYDEKFLCARDLYNYFTNEFKSFNIESLEIRSSAE